jgi:hypothetical protein
MGHGALLNFPPCQRHLLQRDGTSYPTLREPSSRERERLTANKSAKPPNGAPWEPDGQFAQVGKPAHATVLRNAVAPPCPFFNPQPQNLFLCCKILYNLHTEII